MNPKIQASTIRLERAEGLIRECMTVLVDAERVRDVEGRPLGRFLADERAGVWERANAVLAAWSHSAPRAGGGYHKCDFLITYADGETYEGRYDLTHMSVDGYPSLEMHVRDHCEFSSGRRRPAHATEEQWSGYLRDIVGDEKRRAYGEFLDAYAIGSAT